MLTTLEIDQIGKKNTSSMHLSEKIIKQTLK